MAASLSPNAPRFLRIIAVLLLIGLGWLLPASQAQAQSIPGLPAPAASKPAADDVDKLIKTLDDPKAREELKKQLQLMLDAQRGEKAKDAVIEEHGLGARLLASISSGVPALGGR